jgi:hypothetical protein
MRINLLSDVTRQNERTLFWIIFCRGVYPKIGLFAAGFREEESLGHRSARNSNKIPRIYEKSEITPRFYATGRDL